MSSDLTCVALRLAGPLQSWGFESLFNNRKTGLFPSKSAVAGLICAALGLERGGDAERNFLVAFAATSMTAFLLPHPLQKGRLSLSRLTDFHTVLGTKKADGKKNGNAHITRRQYLQDCAFGVVIEGKPPFVKEIEAALANPKWGVWLGRKSCVPSAPVLVGAFHSRDEAVYVLANGGRIETYPRQEDVATFEDGKDTISDVAVSFASDNKLFASRRIMTFQGTHED